MQVGDYIIKPRYRGDTRDMTIGVITKVELDGYLRMDIMCNYNTITQAYGKPTTSRNIAITNTKSTKLYHPTLEELFIFKSFKE